MRGQVSPRAVYAFIAIFAMGALGCGLFLAYVYEVKSCTLCLIARWLWVSTLCTAVAGVFSTTQYAKILCSSKTVTTLTHTVRRMGLVVTAISMTLSLFHVGLERAWWRVSMKCTSAVVGVNSLEDYKQRLMNTPRCDKVSWRFLGMSLAEMNFLAQVMLLGLLMHGLRPSYLRIHKKELGNGKR